MTTNVAGAGALTFVPGDDLKPARGSSALGHAGRPLGGCFAQARPSTRPAGQGRDAQLGAPTKRSTGAVWDFTVPTLVPIASAVAASV